jgi:hypothetical protein
MMRENGELETSVDVLELVEALSERDGGDGQSG